MKNIFVSILIAFMAMPALAPWFSDGAVHAMHDQQATHHNSEANDSHNAHDHLADKQSSVHHPIHFDVVTYFTEFLHVDLKTPNQYILESPSPDAHDIDFATTYIKIPPSRYKIAFVQVNARPDWPWPLSDSTPLYLSTQRLRI